MPDHSVPLINGIPAIGLGTYPLSGGHCTATVEMAIGLGYRHIDTAQMYGNEREVGAALARCGVARTALFVTTKVDPGNLGRNRFSESVKRSVDALGGPPDLLLIHWPPPDAEMDAALDLLKAEHAAGRARRIGVSNFNRPPHMVAVQLRIFTPVGTAMNIVVSENTVTEIGPMPETNMWWAHTPKPMKPMATPEKTMNV